MSVTREIGRHVAQATEHLREYGAMCLRQPGAPVFEQVMALLAEVSDAPIDFRTRTFGMFQFLQRSGKLLLFKGYGVNVIVPMLYRSASTTVRLMKGDSTEWMKDLSQDLNHLVHVTTKKRVIRVKDDKTLTKEERLARPSEIIFKDGPVFVAASGTESLEILRAAATVFDRDLTVYTIDLQTTSVPLPSNVHHVSFAMPVKNRTDPVEVGCALHARMQLIRRET